LKKLPAESLLIDAATELGVERAFIEKDWYAVQVIDAISNMETNNINPIFSGGTSLSKGAKLIKRFSEDIDFRLQFDETIKKHTRKQFKHQIISLFETINGIRVNHDDIFSANESKFFKIPLRYDALFEKPNYIRDELLVAFSFNPPNDDIEKKQIQTFIAELSQSDDKTFIQCVSPCEIAADKLSAFIWRVIFRNRQHNTDDPTFIRHLHDLAALHTTIKDNSVFLNR